MDDITLLITSITILSMVVTFGLCCINQNIWRIGEILKEIIKEIRKGGKNDINR